MSCCRRESKFGESTGAPDSRIKSSSASACSAWLCATFGLARFGPGNRVDLRLLGPAVRNEQCAQHRQVQRSRFDLALQQLEEPLLALEIAADVSRSWPSGA